MATSDRYNKNNNGTVALEATDSMDGMMKGNLYVSG